MFFLLLTQPRVQRFVAMYVAALIVLGTLKAVGL